MADDVVGLPDQVVVLDLEKAKRFLRLLKANSFVTIMYVEGQLRVYMKDFDDEEAKEMLLAGLAVFMHQ